MKKFFKIILFLLIIGLCVIGAVVIMQEDSYRLHILSQLPTSQAPSIDPNTLSGQFISETGTSRYLLRMSDNFFSFQTLIDDDFLDQTVISPFEIRHIDQGVEIFGSDKQSAGAVIAWFKITFKTDETFLLERVKPIGGNLGIYRKIR